ncbi:MAG TPA: hypothetical protein VMB85_16785 [Bryobacteraceae bacterium]|nr:hypothetical protein [Bryobacteraceae bacterium]
MNAIEILEQAVNLLRGAPAALLIYLTGAVPFAIALLFFLNDMNRSPFAFDHLAAASAGLAALYIWKSVWQALFARQLYQTLSPDQPRPALARLTAIQAALQPLGLAIAGPFPWLVAFFRNVALFAALGSPRPLRAARRQAVLWTAQNWGILALTGLAGLILFANLLLTIAFLPQLARSFLGIEGEFARIGMRIFNLTTFAVAATVTWMMVDPLLDAVYVLRCFYGQSIASGEDLRAALRHTVATTMLIALFLMIPGHAGAQVDPVQLDHSIDRVIHSREFTWREPHPAGAGPQGRWVGWIRSAEDLIARGWDALLRLLREIFENHSTTGNSGRDSPVTPHELEGMLAIAVALAAGATFVFFPRRRRMATVATAVTIAAPAVDVADESVTADQLPESSWLKLAEEWLEKGDCRLALRALYLAGLKYLAGRNLVSIRRWKSGLDYRREIGRRARATPEIPSLFSKNVDLFERGWYGSRAVDRGMVNQFSFGLSEIRRMLEQN